MLHPYIHLCQWVTGTVGDPPAGPDARHEATMATNENPCTSCANCGGCESIDVETEHEHPESSEDDHS